MKAARNGPQNNPTGEFRKQLRWRGRKKFERALLESFDPSTCRAVVAAILELGDYHADCSPSDRQIARKSGHSTQVVGLVLAQLERRGETRLIKDTDVDCGRRIVWMRHPHIDEMLAEARRRPHLLALNPWLAEGGAS